MSKEIKILTSLSTKLATKQRNIRANMKPASLEKMDATSQTLAARYAPNPIPEGEAAPQFMLPNPSGGTTALSELLAKHSAVVLTWYRGGWCPYCNLTLRELTSATEEIEKLGAKLVCLTPETPDESLNTKEKNEFSFEVLTDDGCAVAESYGVAFTVGKDVKELYAGFGLVALDEANRNGEHGREAKLPLPATFVIGKNGKVVWNFADLDYTKRAEPSDIIEASRAII